MRKRKAWYYRWSPETYLAYHAIRTLVSVRCGRVIAPERRALVFSTRLLRLRLARYLRWENVRAAIRMFFHKYGRAVTEKKKWWFAIDCIEFMRLDVQNTHNYLVTAESRGRKKVEEFLRRLLLETLREAH
ncbi:MAG: hypothetical protein LM577_07090 [Thermoproteaceae archaeon]|nr:hypothetical protein [Thermoproteaceae archaeon]